MKLALYALLLLLPMIPTFWAIIHVLSVARFERPLPRFGWLAVVTLLPVVGALVYWLVGRPRPLPPGSSPSAQA